jgi:hypothetical protein
MEHELAQIETAHGTLLVSCREVHVAETPDLQGRVLELGLLNYPWVGLMLHLGLRGRSARRQRFALSYAFRVGSGELSSGLPTFMFLEPLFQLLDPVQQVLHRLLLR